MDARRAALLDAMQIDRYASRARAQPGVPAPAGEVAGMDWEALEQAVAGCRKCALCEQRTQTVFGVGDRAARWLIVGEAPGADEDREGEPFVGRAGQLLSSMLRSLGLARESVFIANVLKCRPPGNRDPEAGEIASCLPYLHRQIELIAPALLLCVGRVAAHTLLATDTPVGKLRQQVHRLPPFDLPLIVTYHPAYLLRSPHEKRKAWSDLRFAREVARGALA
jgi:uracil-DNA glycosylase